MDEREHHRRIRVETRQFDSYPVEMEATVKDDCYMLLAPLRQTAVRVMSGHRLLVDGEVRPGMLRVAAPGEHTRVLLRAPARNLVFLVPREEMRSILDRSGSRGDQLGSLTRSDPRIARAARAAADVADFDGSHRQLFIDGITYQIIACLLSQQAPRPTLSLRPHLKTLSRREFERCCEYADACMEKTLDLSAWASTLGMTSTEFSRRFHQTTQQAPYAWFMDRRIDRAKAMLGDSKISIAETAFSAGFCSQSHFTEAFRRRVGCSPGRWRTERCAGIRYSQDRERREESRSLL